MFLLFIYFLSFVVLICGVASWVVFGEASTGLIITIILCAVVTLLPIILMIWADIANKKDAKQKEFYQKCLKSNIKDLSTPAEIEKAQLIAKQLKCSDQDLQELFSKGKSMCKQQEDTAEQERLRQIRCDEENTYKELSKYSNLFGREKRIAMLTDKRNEWLQSSKSARLVQKALVNASIQKEHDWATHGGLAAGIAGGAAGVAVAMDVQRKNAAIREQNAANLKAISPAFESLGKSANDASKYADSYEEDIRETETKLVSELPANELFRALEIGKPTVDISETGAFTVEVEVSKPEALHIYDTVRAVIDGTLAANVYQNETYVGTALLVLPCYGLGGSKLRGICLANANKDLPCRVEIEPYKLWAIEQ